MNSIEHTPVLLDTVLEIFDPKPGNIYIDATVNGGGHATALREKVGENGLIIGIDRDDDLVRAIRAKNQECGIKNFIVEHDNYSNIKKIAEKHGIIGNVDGILFDLGFSSYHIERSGRGFSFQRNEPLDMRYDRSYGIRAADILNTWPREKIEDLLRRLGGERYARRIAEGIVHVRREKLFETTDDLVAVITRSVPRAYLRGRIHPATRTFQALRIAVNDELGHLESALGDVRAVLRPGGIAVIISFHSEEDRIVKLFAKTHPRIFSPITKKSITASREEVRANPRARSALLRALQRI